MQRLTAALLWLLGGVALATVLSLLAPLGWPFELFSHFRVQYAAAALLLSLLLAWRRAAVPSVLALVLAGWPALPGIAAQTGAAEAQDCAGPVLTVATGNVQFSNAHPQAFRPWLAPDVARGVLAARAAHRPRARLAQPVRRARRGGSADRV